MSSQPPAVSVRSLTRVFEPRVRRGLRGLLPRFRAEPAEPKRIVAVNDLDLDIAPGHCFGLLGPNGAGKTTTVKMLATLLEPTSGSASVAGFDVTRSQRQVRRNIGVLFAGERGMYWRLSGRENLELFGTLSFMPRQSIQERIEAAAHRFGLEDRMDELVETYSTGMKQRLNLARATLHDPPVLLLDEPTAALDPVAAREARHLIRQIAESGTAILLTTHNLYEAEQICDRVGIIQSGSLVAQGRPADLIRQAGEMPRLDLLLRGDLAVAKAVIGSDGLWWGEVNRDGEFAVAARAPDGWRSSDALTTELSARGIVVEEARLREPDLEDAYIAITGSRIERPFIER
ncbi:MAG: ABC transporter ATP-binding protein [Chloroflexi bacterium]|nr:ABC transporter ATP-binding protein [Chloroflexota bacterium]